MSHFGNHTKQLAALAVAIVFSLGLSFCTGGKKDGVAAPEGMQVYDLSRYGKPFSIFVPDTTKTKIEVTEQSTGALEIKAGPNFAIAINEQFGDLNQIRSDLKGDEVNKLKQLLVDEAEALVWESEVVQPEFHFFVNKKFNNAEYSFEDIKSTEAEPFRRDAIERMYDACKNTQAIQK
jgi:hypothetical protein